MFEEHLAICRRLTEQDPSNAVWRRELTVAQRRLARIFQAMRRIMEAQATLADALTILDQRADQEPANKEWQHDLALAQLGAAKFHVSGGRYATALPFFARAQHLLGSLVQAAPGDNKLAKKLESQGEEFQRCRSLAGLLQR